MSTERPEIVEDEMLTFLDDLRERGEVNMSGAADDLRNESSGMGFHLSKRESRAVLKYWMVTFGDRQKE